MPGTYGTSAFKSSGRREAKPSSQAEALFTPPGVAAPRHTPADAAFRSKSPRFRDQTPASATTNADFFVPPGVGSGHGASRAATAAFKQTGSRFRDPTNPCPSPGLLDSDAPVEGLAKAASTSRSGSAVFRTGERFKHDPRSGVATRHEADFYVPPGIGSGVARRVPTFRKDGTRRFNHYHKSAAANADLAPLPGMAAAVFKRPGGGFAKAAPRWKESEHVDKAKSARDRGADFYAPKGVGTSGRGGATAAFRASPRFKEPSDRARSRSPAARDDAAPGDLYVPKSFVDESKGGLGAVAMRSHSPRFDRVRTETATAEFAGQQELATVGRTACPASAAFRSTTPRTASARDKSAERSSDYYNPPSFVDAILAR